MNSRRSSFPPSTRPSESETEPGLERKKFRVLRSHFRLPRSDLRIVYSCQRMHGSAHPEIESDEHAGGSTG